MRKRVIALNIWLAAATLLPSTAAAQEIECAADTVRVCDTTEGQRFTLRLRDLPAGYAMVRIYYSTSLRPNERNVARQYVNNLTDDAWSVAVEPNELTAFEEWDARGYADFSMTVEEAWLANSDGDHDRIPLTIVGTGRTTWRIFPTPQDDPSLPDEDPALFTLGGDTEVCGHTATLTTQASPAGISEWTWAATGDVALAATANSAIISWPGAPSPSARNTAQVSVSKTIGKTCTATLTRTITLRGTPEATLTTPDGATEGGVVKICTSIPDADDPGRDIMGRLTLSGAAPFAVTLSSGDTHTFDSDGAHTLTATHAMGGGALTIASVTDGNQCPATTETMRGSITIEDRKPLPAFAAEDVENATTSATLEVRPSDAGHAFEWGMDDGGERLDASVEGMGERAEIRSNMNAAVGVYVVETDHDGEACPSDTTRIVVRFAMPLRYPNGISPNGDGRNDRLVIEGLPPENHVTVVDSRGKRVFEATNYRNDWGAEGLDDGYYAYIASGRGMKTIRETLVVKRTK